MEVTDDDENEEVFSRLRYIWIGISKWNLYECLLCIVLCWWLAVGAARGEKF